MQHDELPATEIGYEHPSTANDVSAVAAGTIGLVLLGLKMLIEFLNVAAYIAVSLPHLSNGIGLSDPIMPMLIVAAIHFVASITLLIFARPLSTKLFGKLSPLPLEVGPRAWMTIVVAGVGLFVALDSLDVAARGISTIVARIGSNVTRSTPTPVDAGELFQLLIPLVKVGLGLLLVLRPRAVVGWWSRNARL